MTRKFIVYEIISCTRCNGSRFIDTDEFGYPIPLDNPVRCPRCKGAWPEQQPVDLLEALQALRKEIANLVFDTPLGDLDLSGLDHAPTLGVKLASDLPISHDHTPP